MLRAILSSLDVAVQWIYGALLARSMNILTLGGPAVPGVATKIRDWETEQWRSSMLTKNTLGA